jgi:hypothetical protein
MQTEIHQGGEQTNNSAVYRVHYLSRVDDNRYESLDILAYRVEVVAPRTINADGVMIQFQSDIVEISPAEQRGRGNEAEGLALGSGSLRE